PRRAWRRWWLPPRQLLLKEREDCASIPPLRPLLVELAVDVVHAHAATRDDHLGHFGADFEGITPGDEEIRELARLEATDLLVDAQNRGGVDGQRTQRRVA